MQLNLVVCFVALLALVVDKWSLFDDSTARYANTPVYDLPARKSTANSSGSVYPDETPSTRRVAEKQPQELYSRDEYEQKMFPTQNRVVLGHMTIPAEP